MMNRYWAPIMDKALLLMKKNVDGSLHWNRILLSMNSRQWFQRFMKSVKNCSVVLSFLPGKMIKTAAPVIIYNDHQVKFFTAYAKKKASVQLCVTFAHTVHIQKNKFNFDLNEQLCN